MTTTGAAGRWTGAFLCHQMQPSHRFLSGQKAALLQQWPDEALQEIELDKSSYVVVLTHDPKLDDPALVAALGSDAFYIGALGSRRTHGARVERLRERSELFLSLCREAELDTGKSAGTPVIPVIWAYCLMVSRAARMCSDFTTLPAWSISPCEPC